MEEQMRKRKAINFLPQQGTAVPNDKKRENTVAISGQQRSEKLSVSHPTS
jgi:hypothetical protein